MRWMPLAFALFLLAPVPPLDPMVDSELACRCGRSGRRGAGNRAVLRWEV